jgi:hypothetical protein
VNGGTSKTGAVQYSQCGLMHTRLWSQELHAPLSPAGRRGSYMQLSCFFLPCVIFATPPYVIHPPGRFPFFLSGRFGQRAVGQGEWRSVQACGLTSWVSASIANRRGAIHQYKTDRPVHLRFVRCSWCFPPARTDERDTDPVDALVWLLWQAVPPPVRRYCSVAEHYRSLWTRGS